MHRLILNIPDQLLEEIDRQRGDTPRTKFIEHAIRLRIPAERRRQIPVVAGRGRQKQA